MPYAPGHHCSRDPRCPHVVTHDTPCPVHGARQPWQSETPPVRIRGRTLQKLRFEMFIRTIEEGRGCAVCGVPFREIAEMIRDHMVPLAEGGADDDSNVQAICTACHRIKIQAESARGARRAR